MKLCFRHLTPPNNEWWGQGGVLVCEKLQSCLPKKVHFATFQIKEKNGISKKRFSDFINFVQDCSLCAKWEQHITPIHFIAIVIFNMVWYWQSSWRNVSALKPLSSAGKRVVFYQRKIKANTVNTCLSFKFLRILIGNMLNSMKEILRFYPF